MAVNNFNYNSDTSLNHKLTSDNFYAKIRIFILIIIIMVIFKCYFSGELIALSYKTRNNNSGVNIELGKTNRLKALCMMEIKK